jgi:dolichyl-phosphate beta-glucosyltransferase
MSVSSLLSVVVPAYNEETRLPPTLERIEEWMEANGILYEILVVDDGSTDLTPDAVERFTLGRPMCRLIRLRPNRGKGAAVREGFRQSRGDRVLFSDADLSTPIGEFLALQRALDAGADVAIASRALRESRLVVRQAWYRERMGKTFNAVVRLLTGIPFRDTQCGFKLFRGDDARALAEQMHEDGFAFDVELLLLARRRALSIREIPVTWKNDDRSRVDAVGDSWRMLRALPGILRRTGRYRG